MRVPKLKFYRAFNRVERSVEIGPQKVFKHLEDLGDIDCMIIDSHNKRVLLVECKDIDAGRTPAEIGQEIDRLLNSDEDEKSRMKIHQERCKWITENWESLRKHFALSEGQWELRPVFVTSEEIPTAMLREAPIPIYALTKAEREGLRFFGAGERGGIKY